MPLEIQGGTSRFAPGKPFVRIVDRARAGNLPRRLDAILIEPIIAAESTREAGFAAFWSAITHKLLIFQQ